jgi:hypothetical protein
MGKRKARDLGDGGPADEPRRSSRRISTHAPKEEVKPAVTLKKGKKDVKQTKKITSEVNDTGDDKKNIPVGAIHIA